MYKYEIVLYWGDAEKVHIAGVSELPGCMAHGDSQEAALKSVNDAIEFWIDTVWETGDLASQPKGERLMLA